MTTAPLPPPAGNPDNRDVPKNVGLTGRQLYIQFCYRMSKFDLEFATLDPVMAQSWLNIGMSRLLHEFEKRLLASPGDRSARRIFGGFCREIPLEVNSSARGKFVADTSPEYRSWKFFPDPISIYIKYSKNFINADPDFKDYPNWWPYHRISSGDLVPESIKVDYLELEGTDERKSNF